MEKENGTSEARYNALVRMVGLAILTSLVGLVGWSIASTHLLWLDVAILKEKVEATAQELENRRPYIYQLGKK